VTSYRFDWSSFATDALYRELASAAGVAGADPLDSARGREVLTRIFQAVGGPTFARRLWSDGAQQDIARQIVREAIRHTLRGLGAGAAASSGYRRSTASHAWIEMPYLPSGRLPVNAATAAELTALPNVGATLARRIVRERETNGAFRSRRDLADRINGLGDATVDAMSPQMVVEPVAVTANRLSQSGSLADDVRQLAGLVPGATPAARLERALGIVAVKCATEPHPSVRHGEIRTFTADDRLETHAATGVGVLLGSDYHRKLPAILDGATTTIEVCLFHAVLPDLGHPTRLLLDALVRAKDRGVGVRVLLDQDRPEDPYGSTIINTPARSFLAARNIPCRFDQPDRLLHSKYLIVDQQLAIVGSHNWSAGSYFLFDDLSLVVASAPLIAELQARFQRFWNQGS
jgi:hypothetical protein